LYWFANNIWTFGQQHYVFGMIEKEDEAKKQEAIQRRAANSPAPGAKPKRTPKTALPSGNGSAAVGDGDTDLGAAQTDPEPNPPGPDGGPSNRASRGKRRKR
jgi:YidC/Oxa1 family membrane protein insertase